MEGGFEIVRWQQPLRVTRSFAEAMERGNPRPARVTICREPELANARTNTMVTVCLT